MAAETRLALSHFLRLAREPGRVIRTQAELLERIQRSGPQRIVTLNLFELRHYVNDPSRRALVDAADAWTADGWPIARAFGRVGVPAERVTGSGLCRAVLDLPPGCPQRLMILGADPATVTAYALQLSRREGRLVYTDTGPRDDWTTDRVRQALGDTQPDLVLIAVGTPWGVEIAARLQPVLTGPVVAVGAGVGMAVGMERRAPQRAQDLHLEWLWRLAKDPRRLWRRYLIDCATILPALALAAQQVSSGD